MRYEELGDQELVALVTLGHERALEFLYDRYSRQLYSLVRRLLSDTGAAEEVVQEVFLSLWRRASSYSPEKGRVASWLMSIAHHRAVDQLRRRRREYPLLEAYGDLVPEGQRPHNPEEGAMQSALSQQVAKAVAKLPVEQQQVVNLAYLQGYTQTEIAKRLGQPLGTVKTRMRLGVQKLREALEPLLEDL